MDQFPAPDVFPFNFETVDLQVPDPGTATASAGFLIDRYGARIGRRLGVGRDGHYQRQGQKITACNGIRIATPKPSAVI
jgi:hypothetical protein